MVFNMMSEDPGKVDFSDIGGLGDQLRILRETIELPLTNPELFKRVGIRPPKGTQYFMQVASCTVLLELERLL
jgi:26S proteasome regulatory subunit T4